MSYEGEEIDFLTGAVKQTVMTPEQITEAQARAAVESALTVKVEIARMERETMMPRAVREFMLMFMEANFTPAQLAGNPGYQKVKAFDNQIKVLRGPL